MSNNTKFLKLIEILKKWCGTSTADGKVDFDYYIQSDAVLAAIKEYSELREEGVEKEPCAEQKKI